MSRSSKGWNRRSAPSIARSETSTLATTSSALSHGGRPCPALAPREASPRRAVNPPRRRDGTGGPVPLTLAPVPPVPAGTSRLRRIEWFAREYSAPFMSLSGGRDRGLHHQLRAHV